MNALILGGSGSGKSEYAEKLVCQWGGARYYIATMEPFGEEGAARVSRHQQLRQGKGFLTIEKFTDIGEIRLPERGNVLLECVGNLVANEMFRGTEEAAEKILADIGKLEAQAEHIVVVSNDVFRDGQKYDQFTEKYIENIGYINSALALRWGGVTEVVVGIPLQHRLGGA